MSGPKKFVQGVGLHYTTLEIKILGMVSIHALLRPGFALAVRN